MGWSKSNGAPGGAPGKASWRIQGPQEVAGHSGAAALGEEHRGAVIVVGDGCSMALHRLDLDHPRQEHLVQRLR